ncbi:MAG: hypothetical protein DCC55_12790 [Chloroflexi bacterium]|nr:MAG: hypothetical protein DCC55_12790 [Chloroflexota bacterium]
MDRRNVILSGILVVQLALVAFLFWPNRGGSAAVGALLPGIEEASITEVKIQATDATIELAKEGDSWVLANYGGYPVDTFKVNDLITKALSIDTSRLVANTASSHNRLQVADDEYVRKIDLTSGGQPTTLYIGSSPSLRATNVRAAGSDAVYLTGDLRGTDIRTDVGGWVDLIYFQTPSTDAQAVTIENANGALEFTRVNTDTWTLKGLEDDEVFSQNNFTTILTRLGGLNMVAPVGKEEQPEFGMDNPSATVTVVSRPPDGEEKTLTLVIGAKDEGGTNYYAKSSESDFYVKIASFSGDSFVNDTRDRYIQPPPTPEASSTLTETGEITTAVPITSFAPFEPLEGITATDELTASEAITASEIVSPSSPLATPTPNP